MLASENVTRYEMNASTYGLVSMVFHAFSCVKQICVLRLGQIDSTTLPRRHYNEFLNHAQGTQALIARQSLGQG